jgi:hypothetical protein
MADTQRTRAQILALFADNVTGQISPQDLRDFVVTIMESEFANPGDFFARPQAKFITTDKTAKGWKEYSQFILSACSFMNVLYYNVSGGGWGLANVSASAQTGIVALAMDSYAAGISTGVVLKEGIVYDSTFSTIFSQLIGRPVYLASGVPGSITVTKTTNSILILGAVCHSDDMGYSAIGKWYFKPEWAVRGQ